MHVYCETAKYMFHGFLRLLIKQDTNNRNKKKNKKQQNCYTSNTLYERCFLLLLENVQSEGVSRTNDVPPKVDVVDQHVKQIVPF